MYGHRIIFIVHIINNVIFIFTASNAGIHQPTLVPEPTAALISHLFWNKEVVQYNFTNPHLIYKRTWMLIDIGGGTTDFTKVMARCTWSNNRPSWYIKNIYTTGDCFLGGTDFTTAVIEYLKTQLSQRGIQRNEYSDYHHKKLWDCAEALKQKLYFETVPTVQWTFRQQTHDLSITKQVFQTLIQPLIIKFQRKLKECTQNDDIDYTLIVGGCALCPYITDIIRRILPTTQIEVALTPTKDTCFGASLIGSINLHKYSNIKYTTCCAHNIGLESNNKKRQILVKIGTPLPFCQSYEFPTNHENKQTECNISEGNTTFTIYNNSIGSTKSILIFIDTDGILCINSGNSNEQQMETHIQDMVSKIPSVVSCIPSNNIEEDKITIIKEIRLYMDQLIYSSTDTEIDSWNEISMDYTIKQLKNKLKQIKQFHNKLKNASQNTKDISSRTTNTLYNILKSCDLIRTLSKSSTIIDFVIDFVAIENPSIAVTDGQTSNIPIPEPCELWIPSLPYLQSINCLARYEDITSFLPLPISALDNTALSLKSPSFKLIPHTTKPSIPLQPQSNIETLLKSSSHDQCDPAIVSSPLTLNSFTSISCTSTAVESEINKLIPSKSSLIEHESDFNTEIISPTLSINNENIFDGTFKDIVSTESNNNEFCTISSNLTSNYQESLLDSDPQNLVETEHNILKSSEFVLSEHSVYQFSQYTLCNDFHDPIDSYCDDIVQDQPGNIDFHSISSIVTSDTDDTHSLSFEYPLYNISPTTELFENMENEINKQIPDNKTLHSNQSINQQTTYIQFPCSVYEKKRSIEHLYDGQIQINRPPKKRKIDNISFM